MTERFDEIVHFDAVDKGLLAVKQLVQDNPECPDLSLGTVLAVNVTFRSHVEGRANAAVAEGASKFNLTYLACTAKPKSAILTCPSLRKTLAGFRSRCTMCF